MQRTDAPSTDEAVSNSRPVSAVAAGDRLLLDATQPWCDALPHGLCRFDASDRLVLINKAFRKLYGLTADDTPTGASIGQVIASIDRRDLRDVCIETISQATTPTSRDERPGSLAKSQMWQTSDGRHIAIACHRDSDGGSVLISEDVGRLEAELAEVSRLANVDALTGALNRHAFMTKFAARFAGLKDDQEMAVLYIDLDHFKPVNDMYGHPTGDRILQAVTERLQNLVGPNDLVARVGGDEFVILQSDQPQPASSRQLGNRIIQRLREPFPIDDQVLHIGGSVGVSMAPYDADNAEDLIKNADLALYGAKSNGRGVLRYFEPEMESAVRTRRVLEAELRLAVECEAFELHYQPVMDLIADRIVSFEALIRWQHPTMGPMRPDQFIPLAEETGLIVPIGRWVLHEACKQAVTWNSDISLAVNVSPLQLRDRSLFSTVHDALQDSGLSPERLELEITENALIADTSLTIGLLHQIRDLGVRIAMDDFGTGYSSINYLRKFPFDKIKIDRSFVSGSDHKSESTALVKMIASLGISLGVKTTAEGVETSGEMESVRSAGCSEIQGYLLSKPIPASAVRELLSQTQDAQINPTKAKG